MHFEFATARRIIFGPDTAKQLPALTAEISAGRGNRVLVLTGNDATRVAALITGIGNAGMVIEQVTVTHEPSIESVQSLTAQARRFDAHVIVAIGGGSVIDAAKAVAAMLTNPGDLLDYLEIVGAGKKLAQPAAPVIAVPTTAGTGAEVTRNAVLAVPATADRPGLKVSLRSPHMLPALALVDPVLTHTLPPAVTATTGMDALTQCIEPYVSPLANPLSDGPARAGIQAAARSLRRAYTHGDDLAARTDMALASLCGGLALANAKLGAVHGFAGVLGGMFPAPHGALCARLLPPVFEVNAHALQNRGPAHLYTRLAEVAQWLTGDPAATPAAGAQWLARLVEEMAIPRLRDWQIERAQFPTINQAALKSSSMQGNPVQLTDAECAVVLEAAY